MSEQLREFLTAWLAWAENGAPSRYPFNPANGLCACAAIYADATYGDEVDLLTELANLFEDQGLNANYPFGQYEYDMRHLDDTQHLDPNRLAWVREQLK